MINESFENSVKELKKAVLETRNLIETRKVNTNSNANLYVGLDEAQIERAFQMGRVYKFEHKVKIILSVDGNNSETAEVTKSNQADDIPVAVTIS